MDAKVGEDKVGVGVGNVERRKHPRFLLDIPIEYYRSKSSTPSPGRTGDISEGGLLVYLSERVEIGEKLKVRLFLKSISESMDTVQTLTEVAWIILDKFDADGRLESCRCGLKFIYVNPKDMEKMKVIFEGLTQV